MMRHLSCRREHRGLATVLAIVLIGLVGASLTGMAAFSAADFRRSRSLAEGARLRQLLLAGAADVMTRSHSWKQSPPAVTWKMALPGMLKDDARVEIQLESTTGESTIAHVTAKRGARTARQAIHLANANGHWKLVEAELESQ